ncbi:MAG: hypothetical protein WA840_20595 [Caulobacteraceae bacterium]
MQTVPVKMTVVDAGTGAVKEERQTQFMLLPPAKGTCIQCGREHDPAQPHDAQRLHYQYSFYGEHGRWPTWIDALTHCTPEIRAAWVARLTELGVDVEGGQLAPAKAPKRDAAAQPRQPASTQENDR